MQGNRICISNSSIHPSIHSEDILIFFENALQEDRKQQLLYLRNKALAQGKDLRSVPISFIGTVLMGCTFLTAG